MRFQFVLAVLVLLAAFSGVSMAQDCDEVSTECGLSLVNCFLNNIEDEDAYCECIPDLLTCYSELSCGCETASLESVLAIQCVAYANSGLCGVSAEECISLADSICDDDDSDDDSDDDGDEILFFYSYARFILNVALEVFSEDTFRAALAEELNMNVIDVIIRHVENYIDELDDDSEEGSEEGSEVSKLSTRQTQTSVDVEFRSNESQDDANNKADDAVADANSGTVGSYSADSGQTCSGVCDSASTFAASVVGLAAAGLAVAAMM